MGSQRAALLSHNVKEEITLDCTQVLKKILDYIVTNVCLNSLLDEQNNTDKTENIQIDNIEIWKVSVELQQN